MAVPNMAGSSYGRFRELAAGGYSSLSHSDPRALVEAYTAACTATATTTPSTASDQAEDPAEDPAETSPFLNDLQVASLIA